MQILRACVIYRVVFKLLAATQEQDKLLSLGSCVLMAEFTCCCSINLSRPRASNPAIHPQEPSSDGPGWFFIRIKTGWKKIPGSSMLMLGTPLTSDHSEQAQDPQAICISLGTEQ